METKTEFITSNDEHWYPSTTKSGVWYPSVTTILSIWPKGIGFQRYLANQESWDASQETLKKAGDRGTKVHKATEVLEEGGSLHRDSFTLEEWQMLMGFVAWHTANKPKLVFMEKSVVSDDSETGGTIDRVYLIGSRTVLLDIKTSSSIHEQYWAQTGKYAEIFMKTHDIPLDATAILRLAPRRKDLYEYEEHTDFFSDAQMFDHIHSIWKYLNPKAKPKVIELPVVLTLPRYAPKPKGRRKKAQTQA